LKQSKGATSVGVVVIEVVTGDPAFCNRVWTSVAACKIIAKEPQIICETEKQTKKIFMRALFARKKR
jgi:hypothetical protein